MIVTAGEMTAALPGTLPDTPWVASLQQKLAPDAKGAKN